MEKEKSWRSIFESFLDKKKVLNYSYKNLLFAAGHLKSRTGGFTVKKWMNECNFIDKKLEIKKGNTILEIGSGSGALLKYFQKKAKVYGADYSPQLLNLSKKAIPNGKFQLKEASKINYEKNFFDVVILYSCIQYFDNTKYFKKVISKIKKILKKDGKLFIGEIVDNDNLKNFEKHRKSQIGPEKYNLMYKNNKKLKHYALGKLEILKLFEKDFKGFEIYNSIKRGNEKDYYRFNFICSKK